eukprot:CAMPEP_0170481234 /NCGR_PEP_ID=MMETSP0208-20121228/1756_1 /TAXON_ID=197538 /ORGANISM="Strombidium inclinatum, Strain S3" /LENGTH=84 /DNA_ID=CAMNT_0010753899 /DNA_START=1108 /DNA_END=1362 /DNA_ORIENTATION=+
MSMKLKYKYEAYMQMKPGAKLPTRDDVDTEMKALFESPKSNAGAETDRHKLLSTIDPSARADPEKSEHLDIEEEEKVDLEAGKL